MPEDTSTSQFLPTVQPDPDVRAYVLGAQAYRVSIHTQQARAIQLAHLLASDKKFVKGEHPSAVIGGGVAGLTMAISLALIGKEVVLYEQSDRLIPLQFFNSSRYVHPFAANWPANHFCPSSELPYLNWYADYASAVAQKIFAKYVALRSHLQLPIEEKKGARVSSCCQVGGFENVKSFEVRLDKGGSALHDSVFFTEGFGHEKKLSGYDNYSYWEDTSLSPKRVSKQPPKIAVIGDGDGALMDVARAIYPTRTLEKIYDGVARELATEEFREKVKAEEANLTFVGGPQVSSQGYIDAFKQLAGMRTSREFFDQFSDREIDCQVDLICTSEFGFSAQAAPINKFVLMHLLQNRGDKVRVKRMRASAVKARELSDNTFKYTVSPSKDEPFTSDDLLIQKSLSGYDRVLERVGPSEHLSQLVRGLFEDEDLLVKFGARSREKFPFANPVNAELEAEENIQRFLEESRINEGTNDLIEYFSLILSTEVKDHASQIYFDPKSKSFNVKGVALPKLVNSAANESVGDGREDGEGLREIDYSDTLRITQPRLSKLPHYWYGEKLIANDIEHVEIEAPRTWHGARGNANFGVPVTEKFEPFLFSGQRVQLCETSLPEPMDGRLSYFCRAKVDGQTYALVPRHIVSDITGQHRVCALGLPDDQLLDLPDVTVDEARGLLCHSFGEVVSEPFDRVIRSASTGERYTCLNDVSFIRLDSEIELRNTFQGVALKPPVSAFRTSMSDDPSAYCGREKIGEISKVFNHTKIRFPIGEAIKVEVFNVLCNPEINTAEVLSGSPIHTESGSLLGMVVGSRDQELFCLELSKVHGKLGLELV